MSRPTSAYLLKRLEVLDNLLGIAIQEPQRGHSMQRVRQARQTISGLVEEVNHDARKKPKKPKKGGA